MPSPDPHATLCETCGYSIDELPPTHACPECGRPIARSLPAARHGSPWQLTPSAAAWFSTSCAAILTPVKLFGIIRIEPAARSLLRLNCALAAAPLGAAIALWLSTSRGTAPPDAAALAKAALLTPLTLAAMYALLRTLTWIEHRGIRFFGRQRGWRITPIVATAVCAHASIGWVIAAALALCLRIAGEFAAPPIRNVLPDNAAQFAGLLPDAAALTGFLAGLFVFELLIFLGVRRCKFANTPPPTSSA